MLARLAAFPILVVLCSSVQAQCARALLESPKPNARFGEAVAIDGGLALVGGATFAGLARLFDAVSGAELLPLVPPDGFGGQFGAAVDLDGGFAAVGALGSNGSLSVYEVPAGTLRDVLKVPRLGASDGFGGNVAIDGRRVMGGAWLRDAGAEDSGAAYVFDLANPGMPLELVSSHAQPQGSFGSAVAIAGDRALVGAPGEGPQGALYVFDALTGAELLRLTPSLGSSLGFGGKLSVEAGRVLVGCDKGAHVYLFDLATGAELASFAMPSGGIRSVALTDDHALVATNIVELVQVIDLASLQVVAEIRPDADEWVGFGWDLDAEGRIVIAGGPYWKWSERGGAAFLIDLCDAIGTSYCGPAVMNSTGEPARIVAAGRDETNADYAFLVADRMPKGRTGYFLASLTQDFVMGPGGSDGNLCLGGSIARLAAPVENTGHDGSFQHQLELSQLGVLAGETWSFQAWFRDGIAGGGGSNFTDGVSVLFR